MKGLLQNCCRMQNTSILVAEVKVQLFKRVSTFYPFPKDCPQSYPRYTVRLPYQGLTRALGYPRLVGTNRICSLYMVVCQVVSSGHAWDDGSHYKAPPQQEPIKIYNVGSNAILIFVVRSLPLQAILQQGIKPVNRKTAVHYYELRVNSMLTSYYIIHCLLQETFSLDFCLRANLTQHLQ